MKIRNRHIYRDDLDLLHVGLQRVAKRMNWKVLERPSEGEEIDHPLLVTLEELGLERLRPQLSEPTPENPE